MSGTWFHMTAANLGREIGEGRIHPVDLAEAFLDRIARHALAPRIFARMAETRLRAEAMAAAGRARDGRRLGPLDGVPVSWKDNIDTAGLATEAGSALLRHRTPARDAEILRLATAGGLGCLGKTHMSELAFSGLGLNPVTATPPCLNDEAAVPGGSSSGAAASVAFGLAPAAIGTDTGGSVRLPAAWNDLVGFKPAHGRLSISGIVPLAERFDAPGPLAHSVEDCALLFAAIEGRAPPRLGQMRLYGKRLAVLETVAMEDLRDRPAQGFDDAVARLSRAGARIVRLQAPELVEMMQLPRVVVAGEAWGIWKDQIEAAPEVMFPPILDRFRSGAQISAAEYVAGWRRLTALRAAWAERVQAFDAVILPASPLLPPERERLMTDESYYVTENLLALRNTRIANLLGLTAITLPTSQPSCGVQIMAPAGDEDRLLVLAGAAERVLS